VSAISELTGMEQDVITMQDIYLFDRKGLLPDGRVSGMFRATGIRPKCAAELATAGYVMPPEMFDHRVMVNEK
jgi:pilus assembly protein CpaF